MTICGLKHGCYFDKYNNLTMIIEDELEKISEYFPNVSIDTSVIMPNHIHFIISINKQVKGVTLGKIIGAFKGRTINIWLKAIKESKLNAIGCVWQRNYYEHRIRNAEELRKYIYYINSNPISWDCDKYNPSNLKCRGFASRNPKK